jgi:hypothetical protein
MLAQELVNATSIHLWKSPLIKEVWVLIAAGKIAVSMVDILRDLLIARQVYPVPFAKVSPRRLKSRFHLALSHSFYNSNV